MQAAAVMFGVVGAVSEPFERIVRQRESQVLRTAFRILGNWADAEDVAQDTFIRLYRRGVGFDSDAALHAWLYRVTVNLCIDRARSSKSFTTLPDLKSADLSAEHSVMREQAKERLMEALRLLPVQERAAIVLREIEGLSTGEVAEIFGTAEATVRSQISKAMSRLRKILNREEL